VQLRMSAVLPLVKILQTDWYSRTVFLHWSGWMLKIAVERGRVSVAGTAMASQSRASYPSRLKRGASLRTPGLLCVEGWYGFAQALICTCTGVSQEVPAP